MHQAIVLCVPNQIEMNNSLGQNVIFPCGQWLAREMGDGETERILTPQTSDNKESNTERGNLLNMTPSYTIIAVYSIPAAMQVCSYHSHRQDERSRY